MDVCVVGSVRFKDKILEIGRKLESSRIAHSLPVMIIPKEEETPEMTRELVYGHFKKIDRCKILYVINPGGYVGNSVKIEIGYAKGAGKKIVFLEKTNLPELDCLADSVVGEKELEKLNTC
jgi:hypothetical protein